MKIDKAQRMHKPVVFLVLAATVVLTGCNLAPSHKTPALATSTTYPADLSPAAGTAHVTAISWEQFFADERLRQLISMALANNRDLRIAVARIEQARGQYRIQRAEQLPELDGSASGTRNRQGTAAFNPVTALLPPSLVAQSPSGYTYNNFQLGVAVTSFELDFWGRVRNLTEAARSQYLQSVYAERAFRLSLIRNLAAAYLTSVSLAEQVDLAEATVKSRQRGLEIARERLDAGVTSALDFRQSETLLTQAETERASLRDQLAQQRNAIVLLVGKSFDEGSLPPARTLAQQGILEDIDAGIPSALLANRPDLIQSEEGLRAARANVGAARAAFFPTITLTGQYGYASASLDDLVKRPANVWSAGPSLSVPIFDWGARRGDLTVARALESVQVSTYEKAVQTAFREVADALADRRYLTEQIGAQERAVASQTELASLAEERYANGVVQYLEVLDAQRNLFSAQQALITLRGGLLQSAVTLYVALGGGLGTMPALRAGDAMPAAVKSESAR